MFIQDCPVSLTLILRRTCKGHNSIRGHFTHLWFSITLHRSGWIEMVAFPSSRHTKIPQHPLQAPHHCHSSRYVCAASVHVKDNEVYMGIICNDNTTKLGETKQKRMTTEKEINLFSRLKSPTPEPLICILFHCGEFGCCTKRKRV